MSIDFSPRAALCTVAVLAGFGALLSAQLPNGLFGIVGFTREGLLSIRGGAVSEADDQRDIVGAVLRDEARRPGRGNVCLSLAEEGTTFEQEKRAIRGLEQQLRRQPENRARIVAELERLETPARDWRAVPEADGQASPLPPASAQSLLAAEQRLLGQPALSGVEITLDGNAVPAAFRARGGACSALSFTAPARIGAVAFVETRFSCGSGCADDGLYAVARRGERWDVVAVARP